MQERTVTISGASKTFSVTGWRIGWIVAPAELTDAIRKVHDFLTVGAPAPLQEGVAAALDGLPPSFYDGLTAMYRGKRDLPHSALVGAGFRCLRPGGRRWGGRSSRALGRGWAGGSPASSRPAGTTWSWWRGTRRGSRRWRRSSASATRSERRYSQPI